MTGDSMDLDVKDEEPDFSDEGPDFSDDVLQQLLHISTDPSKRLVMGIDFGTTYSAVSFVAVNENEDPKLIPKIRIRSIQNFPGGIFNDPSDKMRGEVPTEIIYSLDPKFRKKHMWDGLQQDRHIAQTTDIEAEIASEDRSTSGEDTLPASPALHQQADSDVDMDDTADFDEKEYLSGSEGFQWGYKVHEAWKFPETHVNPINQALSRFKLLLDSSETTEKVREHLAPTMKHLKDEKVINDELSPIADYLTCLLLHTDSELHAGGYDNSWPVELVMCVPAIWTERACRRMQTAMAIAIQQARFRRMSIENNSIENLFMVSEPEAAAAHVLTMDSTISPGDTFVLLDAGGGTVDANTYTVSTSTPLRLTSEIVNPGGGLFGSSYLNESFRDLLTKRLETETYLEGGTVTLKGIVESLIIRDFELDIKRNFDMYGANKQLRRLIVPGLRDNVPRGFRGGCIYIRHEVLSKMFLKLFSGIESILKAQIDGARLKNVEVQKVVLIGGFAGSPSLRRFLENTLQAISRDIELSVPEDNVATAVASGGVLRALNKDQGPERKSRSSYGILRKEHFDDYKAHKGEKPRIDKWDGLEYIPTIYWVLKKGLKLPPTWICKPFKCSHNFPGYGNKPLKCREILYVSDTAFKSHYRVTHPNNKGHEKVGQMVVDMTFLRDQGIIKPIQKMKQNREGQEVPDGRKYYNVTFDMVIQVTDRDLRCYAIYDGKLVKQGRINIASAFDLGAK